MKIAMISDVHEQWHDITVLPCDLLISAGDYSYLGKPAVVDAFHRWLADQPAKNIISLQGNHELWVEKNWNEAVARVALIDSRIKFVERGLFKIEGFKVYCESVQPEFGGWAWNIPRGEKIARYWNEIPDDVEILVTHGPAHGILDQIKPGEIKFGEYRIGDPRNPLGCMDLKKRIRKLEKLKLHVFGHIHGSSGVLDDAVHAHSNHCVTFVNASICNEQYKPVNPVRYITLEK